PKIAPPVKKEVEEVVTPVPEGEVKAYTDTVAGKPRNIIELPNKTKLIQGLDTKGNIYYEIE
ncbi:unnamed protein product, partial [marine sediment metagenome]